MTKVMHFLKMMKSYYQLLQQNKDKYRLLPINLHLRHTNATFRIQPCMSCNVQFKRPASKWNQQYCGDCYSNAEIQVACFHCKKTTFQLPPNKMQFSFCYQIGVCEIQSSSEEISEEGGKPYH